jgi:protease I
MGNRKSFLNEKACLWLKNYYRTYNESVQAEVARNLSSPKNFVTGPLPMTRDSMDHLEKGFVVESGNLISARWPGDAHLFGTAMARRLLEKI